MLEWYRASLKNRHAAAALRRGLAEELKQARDTALINAKRSDETTEGQSLLIPLTEVFPIYDANIANIGLLTPAQIGAVVRAHGMLRAKVEIISALGSLHRVENAVLHAVVDGKYASILAENNKEIADALSDAIAKLDPAKHERLSALGPQADT